MTGTGASGTEQLRPESSEVYYPGGEIVEVDDDVITFIRTAAYANPRRVCRLCMHPDSAHPLHEMLICHVRGGYVQPHGHSGRSVSFSFIEGRALVVLFEEDGRPKRFIPIGPPGSSRVSFLRLPANTIYTFLLEDDCILILETILGPFDPRQNMWAEWAPPSDAAVAGERYLAELRRASVAALGG